MMPPTTCFEAQDHEQSVSKLAAVHSAPTTAAIACCGLSPKASKVLPTVHAEMLEPETVQYAMGQIVSTKRSHKDKASFHLTHVRHIAICPPLWRNGYQIPIAPSRVLIIGVGVFGTVLCQYTRQKETGMLRCQGSGVAPAGGAVGEHSSNHCNFFFSESRCGLMVVTCSRGLRVPSCLGWRRLGLPDA